MKYWDPLSLNLLIRRHSTLKKRLISTKIMLVDTSNCVVAWWPYGYWARPQIEWARFKPWPGTLCCVLGQDPLLSRCLSPLRCSVKWVLANLMLGTGEGPCEGLASHPWEVEILLVATETGRRIRNDQIWAWGYWCCHGCGSQLDVKFDVLNTRKQIKHISSLRFVKMFLMLI